MISSLIANESEACGRIRFAPGKTGGSPAFVRDDDSASSIDDFRTTEMNSEPAGRRP